MHPIRLRALAFAFLVVSVLMVAAADPADVVADLSSQGYSIESGSGATDACVSESVSDARSDGGNLHIVVLADEPGGGATTFSGATLTALGTSGTVLTVAPQTVGWESVGDVWTQGQLNDALDASLDGSSDDATVRIFVNVLTGTDRNCPTGSAGASSSGAGISGWWILGLVVLVVIGGFYLMNRSSKKATKRRRDALVGRVEAQIADIANDILELEGEVRASGNQQAIDHMYAATEQFSTASDRLAAASTSAQMMNLSYDLDVTIWQLDAAEAILDGNPVPDKPERPKLAAPEPPPLPSGSAPGAAGGGPSPPSAGSTHDQLPEYQRRSNRSSSYGTADLMEAILAMQAMTGLGGLGGGRRRSGSSSGSFGRGPFGRSSGGSSRRTRGGGRRRG